MKDWAIDEDSHLIRSKVEEYLKTVDSSRGGLWRRSGWKLEFRRD